MNKLFSVKKSISVAKKVTKSLVYRNIVILNRETHTSCPGIEAEQLQQTIQELKEKSEWEISKIVFIKETRETSLDLRNKNQIWKILKFLGSTWKYFKKRSDIHSQDFWDTLKNSRIIEDTFYQFSKIDSNILGL